MAVPGTGPGPHEVSWSTSGSQTITLTVVVENGCESVEVMQEVEVEEPLALHQWLFAKKRRVPASYLVGTMYLAQLAMK